MPEIVVVESNILDFESDVVVLKYAQSPHGADAAVAKALSDVTEKVRLTPKPHTVSLVHTGHRLKSPYALFVGVGKLYEFNYEQIRQFAQRAIEEIQITLPGASHVAMTMHGVGYGLDERESFLAQIGGILDANSSSGSIKRISIVEKNANRAQRLQGILRKLSPPSNTGLSVVRQSKDVQVIDAGVTSSVKSHVFVAMPFAKEFEDVYVFGIQGPVNAAGFLCERVDMAIFTGDIFERIKDRIDSAALVVADLSGANANVYLEVGYAWGRGRPTLLLVRDVGDLKFDVVGQRCIIYDSIVDLSKKLAQNLELVKG